MSLPDEEQEHPQDEQVELTPAGEAEIASIVDRVSAAAYLGHRPLPGTN